MGRAFKFFAIIVWAIYKCNKWNAKCTAENGFKKIALFRVYRNLSTVSNLEQYIYLKLQRWHHTAKFDELKQVHLHARNLTLEVWLAAQVESCLASNNQFMKSLAQISASYTIHMYIICYYIGFL